jgi:hypothetical protein
MTPRRRAATGGGLIVATLLATLPVARSAPSMAGAAGSMVPCAVRAVRQVHPGVLPLGASTSITLALSSTCAPITRPLHVVLVLDASVGMKDYLAALQDALASALGRLAGPARPWLEFGVVSFAQQADVKRGLTSSAEQAIAGVRDVQLETVEASAVGLQDALRKALRMLPEARPGRTAADVAAGPREVILVASGGVDPNACDRVHTQAMDVQRSGVLLATACVGPNCDRQCLAEAASWVSGRSFAFRSWSSWTFLTSLLDDLVGADGPFFAPIERITVQDWLHENLQYEGGGNPSRFDGNRLFWAFAPWTDAAITRTYRARAVGVGRYRVSRSITATIHYNGAFWPGLAQTVDLENPLVEVVEPATLTPTAPPPPSATATARLPSATPSPSATPTPIATATLGVTPVTLTPTVTRVDRLFLPVLSRWGCVGGRRGSDVALVMDVSGSMGQPASGYPGSRRDAARVVALALLDALAADDQVTVVQYGAHADVLAQLKPCCAAARAGLDHLGQVNGTRLELAVAAALGELAGPAGRADARRTLVFFTDGDLNQTDGAALEDLLGRARAWGVVAYAVGVSDEADRVVLARLAGAAERVYLTGRDGLVPELWRGGTPPGCG